MVQVVFGGANEFNALLYGQQHPGTLNYFENQQAQIAQMSETLTEAGKRFYANSQELYERFQGAEALRHAQAAIRKVGSVFQLDTVRDLWELGAIQNAPLTMQRWIMAQPDVREAFHNQRCDGFSDTYVDMHPGKIGRDHYDFRRVMNGMVEDDEEHGYKVTFYLDELSEGDRELTLEEKVDVLSTWDIVRSLVKTGKDDPTSAYGGQL